MSWPSTEPQGGVLYLAPADVSVLFHALSFDQQAGSLAYRLLPGVGAGLLESALAVPLWDYLPRFPEKVAMLHYHLIQNHPFIDGNKRFALAATEFFAVINGAFFVISDRMSVALSLAIASGSMTTEELKSLYHRRMQMHYWTMEETYSWLSQLSQEDIDDIDRSAGEDYRKSPALKRSQFRASGLNEIVRRRREGLPRSGQIQ